MDVQPCRTEREKEQDNQCVLNSSGLHVHLFYSAKKIIKEPNTILSQLGGSLSLACWPQALILEAQIHPKDIIKGLWEGML